MVSFAGSGPPEVHKTQSGSDLWKRVVAAHGGGELPEVSAPKSVRPRAESSALTKLQQVLVEDAPAEVNVKEAPILGDSLMKVVQENKEDDDDGARVRHAVKHSPGLLAGPCPACRGGGGLATGGGGEGTRAESTSKSWPAALRGVRHCVTLPLSRVSSTPLSLPLRRPSLCPASVRYGAIRGSPGSRRSCRTSCSSRSPTTRRAGCASASPSRRLSTASAS